MAFRLLPVLPTDALSLTRLIHYPATKNDPIHLIMFPNSTPQTKESEIQYLTNMWQRTLEDDSKRAYFRKVCAEDGTPVGFCEWCVENIDPPIMVEEKKEKIKDENSVKDLESLDVDAWMDVSKLLRVEKRKILDGRKNVFRLMATYVAPEYERKGVGRMLMEWGCEMVDREGREAMVMASPMGVGLYEKFGFEVVVEVRTEKGVYRSMFRNARNVEG